MTQTQSSRRRDAARKVGFGPKGTPRTTNASRDLRRKEPVARGRHVSSRDRYDSDRLMQRWNRRAYAALMILCLVLIAWPLYYLITR